MSLRPRASHARRGAGEEVPVQISRLLDAHQIIIGHCRELAELATKLGDAGTNDLVVSDVLRLNEILKVVSQRASGRGAACPCGRTKRTKGRIAAAYYYRKR